MSTIEDFKNAPVGATAIHPNGSRAMKMDDSELGWIIRTGHYWNGEVMARWGYTLDPLDPAPTTAREALDLAWELAHEVKEGQVIPAGTDYTSTTQEVRTSYGAAVTFPTMSLPERRRAFDRWLEQVKAEAWDEGHHAGQHNEHEHRPRRAMTNPYRQETDK